jgi:hypothetical protein
MRGEIVITDRDIRYVQRDPRGRFQRAVSVRKTFAPNTAEDATPAA